MHLTQCINSQVPQKLEAQPGPSNRGGSHKSQQTNDQHHQRADCPPQDSVSVSTRRNEVTSGRRASASQRSGENPKALRTPCKRKNLRAKQMQRTSGNPMAIRTQQTGVNLETEVTRSHTLTSRGVNTRAGSTHPNQDTRSSLGNIFQRLGCRADLRDTLNNLCPPSRYNIYLLILLLMFLPFHMLISSSCRSTCILWVLPLLVALQESKHC